MSKCDSSFLNDSFDNPELKGMHTKAVRYRDMELHEQYFLGLSGNSKLWTLDHTTKFYSSYPLHIHNFCEIYVFVRGCVNYLVESEIYHLKENDILIIPAGCIHQALIQNREKSYERINLWIRMEALDKLSTPDVDLSKCLTKESVRSNFLLPSHTNENKLIRTAIEQLETLQSEPRFARDVSTQDFLRQIVIYAHHYCTSDLSEQIRDQMLHNTLVSSAINEISKNLSGPITLDSISNALYVSKYHLAHIFKQHMGISVHQYIIDLRLAKAKQMLNTRVSMREICEICGFSNYSNFYKLFKGRIGISPAQYRNLVWNDLGKMEE